mmetsp:Transcript_13787/g.19879  ORF Transcript_13787/g.19879 Transcript_13787/m.19879 type:complete len:298 (+) Transcript_13787:109-1002(+)
MLAEFLQQNRPQEAVAPAAPVESSSKKDRQMEAGQRSRERDLFEVEKRKIELEEQLLDLQEKRLDIEQKRIELELRKLKLVKKKAKWERKKNQGDSTAEEFDDESIADLLESVSKLGSSDDDGSESVAASVGNSVAMSVQTTQTSSGSRKRRGKSRNQLDRQTSFSGVLDFVKEERKKSKAGRKQKSVRRLSGSSGYSDKDPARSKSPRSKSPKKREKSRRSSERSSALSEEGTEMEGSGSSLFAHSEDGHQSDDGDKTVKRSNKGKVASADPSPSSTTMIREIQFGGLNGEEITSP